MIGKNILLDIGIFHCVVAAFVLVRYSFEPYRRGYFEEDLSIRMPYKKNTIPFALLTVVALTITALTIMITEFLRDKRGLTSGKRFLFGKEIPGWIYESYIVIGIYGFGTACQELIVDVGKLAVGRLRPHFYAVCDPIPSYAIVEHQYITRYSCFKTDPERIKNARLSFPSGHACFAMYSAVFFMFYLQSRATWNSSRLLRHSLQLKAFVLAWYVCLSRVSDHMHHWDDVVAGSILGATCAALVFIYVVQPRKFTKNDKAANWDGGDGISPGEISVRSSPV